MPLKTIAYLKAPVSLQATFFAELMRSCIDATNHLILFSTNYLPIAPSIKYPYGTEKIKNVVVIIPAVLFLFFGG